MTLERETRFELATLRKIFSLANLLVANVSHASSFAPPPKIKIFGDPEGSGCYKLYFNTAFYPTLERETRFELATLRKIFSLANLLVANVSHASSFAPPPKIKIFGDPEGSGCYKLYFNTAFYLTLERETRFELATAALGRQCSTVEPLPLMLDYSSTFTFLLQDILLTFFIFIEILF